MPWNNQSGGGGGPWGGGGNSGGPWGQGPRGPSGPPGSPPDLEDIIRRGQDRLRRVLPGGGRTSPAFIGLDRACRAGVLGIPGSLHRAARRSCGGTAVRQAQGRALRARPALPLVADRDGGDRQHLRKAGRYRRRHPRSRQFGPDAVRRPEHRRRAVFRRLSGQRSEGLSVQRRRSRRRAAAGCRKRDARGGRPQPGAGHLPRRPARHRRLGARHHPGLARFLWNRPVGERHLDRGRSAAARSGRRVRRGAARRAGRGPLRRGSQPVFQPEARPGARPGLAGPRRRGRLQEPRRAGGRG